MAVASPVAAAVAGLSTCSHGSSGSAPLAAAAPAAAPATSSDERRAELRDAALLIGTVASMT